MLVNTKIKQGFEVNFIIKQLLIGVTYNQWSRKGGGRRGQWPLQYLQRGGLAPPKVAL